MIRPNDVRGLRLNGNGNGNGNGRPNDKRRFVHKSFIGRAIGGVVGGVVKRTLGATPIGQAVNVVKSLVRRPTRPTAPRSTTARPTIEGQQGKAFGRALKFPELSPAPIAFGDRTAVTRFPLPRRTPRTGITPLTTFGGPCDFPLETAPDGSCREPTVDAFGRSLGVGNAVMGRYGAALEPGSQLIERSVCLPGMQLGNDGLCYNKGAITNSQRQWPRGRRPLLTGGDMRAIGIAARAGAKLDRTTKRLRGLGMMKALPKGRSKPAAHAHATPASAVSVPK